MVGFNEVRRLAFSTQHHLGVVILEARGPTFRYITPVAFKAPAYEQLPTLPTNLSFILADLDIKPIGQGERDAMRVRHRGVVFPIFGIGHQKERRLFPAFLAREEPLVVGWRLAALRLGSLDVLVNLS